MKKTIKSFIAIAASIAALVSCSKEVQSSVEDNAEKLIEVTLIAGNPDYQPTTKTEMSGTTPYWSVGDKIGVSTGTSGNYEFSTGIVAAATSASFTGSTVSGDLYAYYPYDSDVIRTANGVTGKRLNLIKDQNPTATSFDGDADIMVAKMFTVSPANTTVEDLEFARLGAIVKIVLIDKESKMTSTQYPSSVSMTAASALAGFVMVDLVNQSMTEPYYNTSTTVTANYTDATHFAIDGVNGAYLIVAPQTLAAGSSLTIAAATADYTISKTITVPAGGIELLPGKVNTLKINLSSSHITAKSYPYELYTSDIEEGDYLIVSDGVAMKASVSSNRFQYTAVSITDNKIYSPDADCIWHIAQSSGSWTMYNADTDTYAASTGTKNQGALINPATSNALWTFSYSGGWSIENDSNAAASVNANIRRNGASGFATYAADFGTAPVLYKLNDGKTESGIAYARTSDAITYGDALTPPALNNAHGLTISCSSNNTAVATVNASTGEITVVGNAGVAVITVSWDEQTISTVTYRAGTAKYTLTVSKKTPTIAAFVDPPTSLAISATVTKTTTISDGLSITYTSSNETVATVNASTGEVTGVADGNVTISATFAGNENYNAAEPKSYALTVGSGGATELTIKWGTDLSANSGTVGDITFSSSKGNASNVPAYNSGDKGMRVYQGSNITFSCSSGNIKSIVFTVTDGYAGTNMTASNGTYNSTTKTWTGDASSVTIHNDKNKEGTNVQFRFTKVVITYE